MDKKRPPRRWFWYFSLVAALIVVFKLCDNLTSVVAAVNFVIGILTPFVVGGVLALLLHRPSSWLETRFKKLKGRAWPKLARPLALVIVYVLLFGILTLLMSLVMPRLATSLVELVRSLPTYIKSAFTRLETMLQEGPLASFELTDGLDKFYRSVLTTVTQLLSTENVIGALRGVLDATMSVVDVVIGFIVSIYMLAGREHITASVRNLAGLVAPQTHIDTAAHYSRRIAAIFNNYFYGALLDALVVGVVASIGLAIFRVPYAVLLGLLLGILNMIPYFGALIGGVGIVLITLLTNGFYAALGVTIYIIVIQQVDANIIQPRVVGDSVGLRPIYVLLAITLFGGLFGFWGIFLGVPLMAVIQMFVRDASIRKRRREAAKPE